MNFESIDWAATGAFWSGVGSMIAGVALFLTYLKARSSFNDWRVQEQFREDRRLAIEALAAFEEGKEAIASIRSPLSLASEQAVVDKRLREAEDKENIRLPERDRSRHMMRLTVHLRIEHYTETWKRLSMLLPVTKAVFGDRVRQKLLEVFKARQRIFAAAEMFRHNLSAESDGEFEKVIWPMARDPKDDPIIPALENAEKELSEILLPFIRPSAVRTADPQVK